MREVIALVRAGWLSAASYRVGLIVSLAGSIATFIPLFFVADALQPIVQESISLESGEYFSFLLVGLGTLSVAMATASTLPSTISSSISTGTLEALLVTPTPLYRLLAGMSAYNVLWSILRVALMLLAATVVGIHVAWGGLLPAIVILLLIIAAYFSVALVASALILVFRTAGPLVMGVMTASALLGGVYYSTGVIPSWIQKLSAVIPLTYGLRAMRRVLLAGDAPPDVWRDVLTLTILAAALTLAGGWSFALALRHSRRAGTLAQY